MTTPSLQPQRGSVLLVTMCFVAVLAIALTSYIALSSSTMNVSNRSYQTGVSEQVAEMGLERALWSFNNNDWSAWDTTTTPGVAALTLTFPNTKYGTSGITTKINLQVTNYGANWTMGTAYSSQDVVNYKGVWYSCIAASVNQIPPNATYWVVTTSPIIISEGVAILPNSAASTIKTQLRAVISSATLFPNAIAGTSSVYLASGATIIDSYNGSNSPFGAVVASPSVTCAGNTTINGYVASPSFMYNISSTVVKGATGPSFDPSHISSSAYIPQFDYRTSIPNANYNTLTLPPPGTNFTVTLPGDGTTNYPSGDGKYYYDLNADLAVGSNDTLNIVGPVVIRVSYGLSVAGSGGYIVITSSNSSLEVNFPGPLNIGTLSGNGGIINMSMPPPTRKPSQCILISTSSNLSAGYNNFRTLGPVFYGLIYLPNSNLSVSNSVEMYGAISASAVYFNNPFLFHYDSSLRNTTISGADAPVIITEWRELTDPAEKVVFP